MRAALGQGRRASPRTVRLNPSLTAPDTFTPSAATSGPGDVLLRQPRWMPDMALSSTLGRFRAKLSRT
jgi:hypothetical protein